MIAAIDENNKVYNSGLKANDSLPASSFVLWSSEQIAKKASLCLAVKDKNLATINSNGQYEDSGFCIDDSKVLSNVLWSSQKMNYKADKAENPTAGNLAILKSSGQYEDSGIKIDDFSNASTFSLWTSNKTAAKTIPLKVGNLASINSFGQYIDSGLNMDDTTISQNSLWSSKKISKLSNIMLASNSSEQDVVENDFLQFDNIIFQNGNLISGVELTGNSIYKIDGIIIFENDLKFALFENDKQNTTSIILNGQITGILKIDVDTVFHVKVISGTGRIKFAWIKIECIA